MAKKTEGSTLPAEPKERQVRNQAEIVENAIKKMEEKLANEDMKASVTDFIRLLQLQKELKQDQPRQVTVTWVELSDEGYASRE